MRSGILVAALAIGSSGTVLAQTTPDTMPANSWLARSATPAPAARPIATGRRLSHSRRRITSARLAPTAMRRPISRVRCPVTNVVTP